MMGIEMRVKEVAEGKGYNRNKLSKETGIAYSTLVDLWLDRTKRIDRGTLETLCRALGVQPGDLLVYTPDESEGE